jgi:hypothetical protein
MEREMSDEIRRVVTPLQSIAEQVGNNILATLKEADSAGVLTTIVPGFPQDQVVSIPLSNEQIHLISQILHQQQLAMMQQKEELEDDDSDRQIGFQVSEDSENEVDITASAESE